MTSDERAALAEHLVSDHGWSGIALRFEPDEQLTEWHEREHAPEPVHVPPTWQ